MTTRERFRAIMNFQPFDRLPVLEWAEWWDQTIERWHGEGLPDELTDRYDICRYFGLELYLQDWIGVQKAGCPQSPGYGAGIVRSLEEYRSIRQYLYPCPAINRAQWKSWAEQQARGEVVLWFTLEGFFWFPRELLGIERHLYAFYDQPELIHHINRDLVQWMLTVIDEICSICSPDFMTFAEDMSYNHGPMLSEKLFDEFMKPYYLQVVPRLKARDILPFVDSDGDITRPAFWFEEVGIEGILPLERQSGVDGARLRRDHPTMKFIGHFDKMTMNKGEAAMRAEFERLLPVAAKGGFLIGCDHQTPPGVSYTEYQCYLALFREYAQEFGRLSWESQHSE